jgi:hypothetical protein
MTTNYPIPLGTFPLYRGDAGGRNKVTIALTDSNDAPVDMSAFGTTWTCQAQGSGQTITLVADPALVATGVLEVRVQDTDSANLPDLMVFDIEATGGTISPLTVFSGTFTTSGQVTTP